MNTPNLVSSSGERVGFTFEEARKLKAGDLVEYRGECWKILVKMPLGGDVYFSLRSDPIRKGCIAQRVHYRLLVPYYL